MLLTIENQFADAFKKPRSSPRAERRCTSVTISLRRRGQRPSQLFKVRSIHARLLEIRVGQPKSVAQGLGQIWPPCVGESRHYSCSIIDELLVTIALRQPGRSISPGSWTISFTDRDNRCSELGGRAPSLC